MKIYLLMNFIRFFIMHLLGALALFYYSICSVLLFEGIVEDLHLLSVMFLLFDVFFSELFSYILILIVMGGLLLYF